MKNLENKLIEKLNKARKEISEKKPRINFEQISDEIKKSFDDFIDVINKRKNYFNQIKSRRKELIKHRISFLRSLFPIKLRKLLSVPFIYGMVVPSLIFHICIETYHQVCFRLYGIPLVKWEEYFIIDRHLLPHLNWFEKFNCVYCSYVNNLIRYSAEIAGRTERYWCPIKHARRIKNAHSQYPRFVDYADGENLRKRWKELRDFSDVNSNKNDKK